MTTPKDQPNLQVTPEPTRDELAAIVSAVTVLTAPGVATTDLSPDVRPSRWAMAGRRAHLEPLERRRDPQHDLP